MIGRFDHAVIVVRDLNVAIERYRTLGFAVDAGGKHTGLGTYNAIMRFGLDYIELLSVYDEAEANASTSTDSLPDFLAKHEGGLLGYALATTSIQQEAERFRERHLAAVGPFGMQRQRPEGQLLTWSLLVPTVQSGAGPGLSLSNGICQISNGSHGRSQVCIETASQGAKASR